VNAFPPSNNRTHVLGVRRPDNLGTTRRPTAGPGDLRSSNVEPYEPIPLDADPATLQEYVATQALFTYGWQGTEWDSLEWLLFKESSWEADANNPASTARYLFQFLASTSRNYGIDHRDLNGRDPSVEDQVEAGLRYIADRYRTPSGAQRAWLRNCSSSIYGCFY